MYIYDVYTHMYIHICIHVYVVEIGSASIPRGSVVQSSSVPLISVSVSVSVCDCLSLSLSLSLCLCLYLCVVCI